MKKLLRILSTILLLLVVALLVVILIQRIRGKTPTLFGYQVNYIKTPSMEMVIMTGDVILCKQVEPRQLVCGDIITYANDGRFTGLAKGEIICHKVVEDPYVDGKGVWHVQTKGIANSANDPPITGDQVIGRYVKKLPVMTAFYKLLRSKWVFLIIIAALTALLAFEIIRISIKRRKTGTGSD